MPQKRQWRIYLALATIILLGIGVRLIFRCGLCYDDSYAYVAGALRLNDVGVGEYLSTLSGIYENRISIVFPLAMAFSIFGYSEATIVLVPLSFSLLTVLVAFFLGKELFNACVGLLAALLVATIPLDAYYSTSLLPDTTIPLYAGATLLFFVLGQKHGNTVFYMLSGFFLFCAFQSRATSGILILPLFVAAWWSSNRGTKALLLPAATFIILLLLFWSLLFALEGSFFAQLEWFAMDAKAKDFVGTGEFLGHLREMVGLNGNFALLYTLLLPALVYAMIQARQDEAYRLPVVAFVLLYLFFEFGSTTLTSYQPIWKLTRFLTILSIPASLIVASVAVSLFSLSKYWLNLATVGLLATHLLFAMLLPMVNQDQTQWATDQIYPYRTTFEKLSEYDDVHVIGIVNVWWAVRGEVYSRLHDRSYEYQDLKNRTIGDLDSGMTIIYDSVLFTPYGAFFLDNRDYPALQSLPEQTPGGWQLLFAVQRPEHEAYPVYVYRVR